MRIKNIVKNLFIVIIGIFFVTNYSSAEEYKYTNLDINADVLINGTINVKETYTADFFVEKHGIFRTIPMNYSVEGNKFHIDISNINVEGKKFTTKKSRGERTIKIGDPDKYVYGKVDYPISYTVYGLIRNFSGMGYSELYWNIVGNIFDTSIGNVTAVINLPKSYNGFKSSDFLITADGITKTVEQFQGSVDWSHGDKIIIKYNKLLPANHGITLAVKFPNNYFVFDDDKQAKLLGNARIGIVGSIRSFLSGLSESDFAVIFVIVCFVPYFLCRYLIERRVKSGKGYKLRGKFNEKYKVIVQYMPPKGLNSAEVGLLLHRDAEIKDLFSLIYKWAAEGLIKIDADVSIRKMRANIAGGIKIQKIKDIPATVPTFEKKFFNSFMDQDIKQISDYDKKHFDDLNNLKKRGLSMGWFRPEKNLKALLIYFVIFLLTLIFQDVLLLIMFVFIFFPVLPRRLNLLKETEKGAELIAHILGYRQFLQACDERQLRTFLDQDPLYFDKTLPYAIVFGLETEFLKKITPIMKEYNITPTWYSGDLANIGYGITSINTVGSKSVQSVFGGGGGGFSGGGGGGGGGGGSW